MPQQTRTAFAVAVGLLGGDYAEASEDDLAVLREAADALIVSGGNTLEGVIGASTEAALANLAGNSTGVPASRGRLVCAEAVGEGMHHRFTEQWLGAAGTTEFTLAEGEWFPVPDQAPVDGTRPTSRPHHLGVRPGETAHLRRHDGTVEVIIDSSRADAVDALCQELVRVATVYPVATSASTADGYAPPETGRAAHLAREAVERGARVVVLPEMHSPSDDDIASVLDVLPPDALLVPGSRREVVDGIRVNRLRMWFGSDTSAAGLPGVAAHDKFAPFVGQGVTEDITPRVPQIRVHVGHRHRVVGLVCKDLLSLDVVNTLCRLGVSLVVCPAWSAKTDAFAAAAVMVANHAQGVTVVANGPPFDDTDDDVSAIYGRPVRSSTLVVRPRPPAPGLDVHDLSATRP